MTTHEVEHRNIMKTFKVDRYTAEYMALVAAEEGVTESEYLRGLVKERILKGMTKDGMGKSYYNVVIGLIKELKK